MKHCVDCGNMLTELDFGHHCLECSEAGLIVPSQDIERFDPAIYLAPIRPDPRPWEGESPSSQDLGGRGNPVNKPVPTKIP